MFLRFHVGQSRDKLCWCGVSIPRVLFGKLGQIFPIDQLLKYSHLQDS